MIVFVEIGLFTFASHTKKLFAKIINPWTRKETKASIPMKSWVTSFLLRDLR